MLQYCFNQNQRFYSVKKGLKLMCETVQFENIINYLFENFVVVAIWEWIICNNQMHGLYPDCIIGKITQLVKFSIQKS